MREGYHRLNYLQMEMRDNSIIRLANNGVKHKIIAMQVGMEPAGVEARLQKLRQEGKLQRKGGYCNGIKKQTYATED